MGALFFWKIFRVPSRLPGRMCNQSLHKTLPSLTQMAPAYKSKIIEPSEIEGYLPGFQTSAFMSFTPLKLHPVEGWEGERRIIGLRLSGTLMKRRRILETSRLADDSVTANSY